MSRVSEAEMASVVEEILKTLPTQSATFAELRELVPKHVRLSAADHVASASRPSEEVWEQILRNIIAHEREGFVRIIGGIKLEWRGKTAPAKSKAAAVKSTVRRPRSKVA